MVMAEMTSMRADSRHTDRPTVLSVIRRSTVCHTMVGYYTLDLVNWTSSCCLCAPSIASVVAGISSPIIQLVGQLVGPIPGSFRKCSLAVRQ